MAAGSQNSVPISQAATCKRCGEHEAAFVIRHDDLCLDCFVRYVKTKVVKRMEAFRGQHANRKRQQKLLLPLSLGVSSTALLHILDEHSQGQVARSGQANYELHCLHVSDDADGESGLPPFKEIKSRYPRHAYSVQPLMSISDVVAGAANLSSTSSNEIDGLSSKTSESQNISRENTVLSPSSHSDLLNIATTKTILKAAQNIDCDGILWGDTTTRLAEKVLAETAKGRGSCLPWIVNDGPVMDGISFLYPMKDVLKKEIFQFAMSQNLAVETSHGNLTSATYPPVAKTNTIDSLMTEYFRSVEDNYPSIVANVVRTSSKLQPSSSTRHVTACALCDMPVDSATAGVDMPGANGSAQDVPVGQDEPRRDLCYGCDRLMHGENLLGKT